MTPFPSQFDRLPPSSGEAEMCTIAAMLIDSGVIPDIAEIVTAESFFSADHQIIFGVVLDSHRRGRPMDALILAEELKRRNQLSDIGGVQYIGRLLNALPSAAHGPHYAKTVAEKYRLRQIITVCNKTIAAAYAPHDADASDGMLAKLDETIIRIRHAGGADSIRTLEVLLHEVHDGLYAGKSNRLQTGLASLDEFIGGMAFGEHHLISGKAGMGKSQFAKQIIRNMAGEGVPVGIISIEESGQKIATNYLAAASGIANHRLIHRRIGDADKSRIAHGVGKIANLPVFIDDSRQTLSDIQNTATRMVKKHGCRAIVVDHLHIIDGEMDKRAGATEEITKISSGLKFLWKRLKVIGIVCAQENRGGADGERPPELRDLRQSGSLEQDGDVILQLLRPDYYGWKKDQNYIPTNKLHIYINKNKHGRVGEVAARFDGDSQTVTDMPVHDPF